MADDLEHRPNRPPNAAALDRAIAGGDRRAARSASGRTAIGCSSSRPTHHPGRIRAAAPLSRRAGRRRAGAQDRGLSAPHPGRARRLAAVPRRRLRHERQREGLFRAQDDRRRHRRAAHARAREAIRARGGAEQSNVFTRVLLALLRRHDLARGAGDAGRDHAAAEVVSVPPRQDFVLGAHGDRAAAGAAGAEAEGAQSEGRRRSTSCSSRTRRRVGPKSKAPHQKWSWFLLFRGDRRGAARWSSRCFRSARGSARSTRRWRSSPSGSTARTGSARFSRRWPTR